MGYIYGSIIIDGVGTNFVRLEKACSSISVIPQDPISFFETLQRNLDPFEENFSIGQRQLICLVLAVLGSNKILIWDKVNASVDEKCVIIVKFLLI